MNQSEINTALDNAYHQLPAIGNVMDKESKQLISLALQSLFLAMKKADAVTPEVAPSITPSEGSDIQQAVALRKIKVIQKSLTDVYEEDLPGDVKEMVFTSSSFLNIIISEKERPEREVAEQAERDAKFAEEQRLANEAAAEQMKFETERLEKEEADKLAEEKRVADEELLKLTVITDPVTRTDVDTSQKDTQESIV